MSADVAILGIGATAFSAASGRSVPALGLEAARAALADAELGAHEVQAVLPVGGGLPSDDLIVGLGLPRTVVDALPAPGGNAGVGSLVLAEALLSTGRIDAALLVFARNGRSGTPIDRRVHQLPGQQFRELLERPYGWTAPAQWYAMIARRHMAEFGTSKAAMARVALTMREHAQRNPAAMMFGRTMTEADYHASPMITDPYQLFDCCLETDGAVALVVGRRPRPRDRDVRVLGARSARPESPDDLVNRVDWFDIGLREAAREVYAVTGVGPQDVDTAMIYDCFTFEVLHQLEEAGFCSRGGSSDFVLSGALGIGGELPTNTHGGLLSEGHLLGMSHIAEAVRQLRGEARDRQVDRARIAAVTGWGDWGDGSIALLAGAALG